MDAQYLFRGMDGGAWFYGSYVRSKTKTGGWCHRIFTADGSIVEIVFDTLGQCVGLGDIYNQLVFKDDVLMCMSSKTYGVVQYENGCWGIRWKDFVMAEKELLRRYINNSEPMISLKKVGNIHDNPEFGFSTAKEERIE